MTDDLLKRARRLDTCIFPTERSKCLCGELADRIQKLESALAHIYAWYPVNVSKPHETIDAIKDYAFAVIKGEIKDD